MKLRVVFCLTALLLGLPLPALAQVPPTPQAATDFPALPPSRPCTKDDILGIWQLLDVYEDPAGRELADFKAFRYQYLFFTNDNLYATLKPARPEKPIDVMKGMAGEMHTLQQFVVDKSGFLFFYQNRVATDTQACFIVANRAGKFYPGEMLIMPPQGQHVGRLVKVYGDHWVPPKLTPSQQKRLKKSWPPKRK